MHVPISMSCHRHYLLMLFDFQLCLAVEVLFGNKVSNIVEARKPGHVGDVLTCMWS